MNWIMVVHNPLIRPAMSLGVDGIVGVPLDPHEIETSFESGLPLAIG